MVTKKELVQLTESSIASLISRFMKTQYFFYTENDLHTFLFSEIYNRLPLEEWLCKTKNHETSMLLHKEYPTKERYNARTLKQGVEKGSRGHYDLSIWNPETTSDRLVRAKQVSDFQIEQQTFIAVEFDLIEGNRTLESALHHFKWDLLKLKGKTNEVEHGYQLVFARDWIHKDDFIVQAREEAAKAGNTKIVYAETKGSTSLCGTLSPNDFLDYRPIFK